MSNIVKRTQSDVAAMRRLASLHAEAEARLDGDWRTAASEVKRAFEITHQLIEQHGAVSAQQLTQIEERFRTYLEDVDDSLQRAAGAYGSAIRAL